MEIKPEIVDQIWGEAVTIYKKGVDLMFDEDTENELITYRDKFIYRDEVELQVLEYLEMPIPNNWEHWSIQQQHQYTAKYFDNSPDFESGSGQLEKVSTRELMYNLFMRNSNDRQLSKKINSIMEHLPDWEKRTLKINGKAIKGFKRIKR